VAVALEVGSLVAERLPRAPLLLLLLAVLLLLLLPLAVWAAFWRFSIVAYVLMTSASQRVWLG
jgi:hypothetical protein